MDKVDVMNKVEELISQMDLPEDYDENKDHEFISDEMNTLQDYIADGEVDLNKKVMFAISWLYNNLSDD